ncbi:hypothetical protein ACN4EK_18660 [Pantanalinema rosaneae CENA516]|uniref:hypothetical protein n=1 Tax=Pantanalinema rosaneae TaxID=1620701 RepID=UPI003D6FFFE8
MNISQTKSIFSWIADINRRWQQAIAVLSDRSNLQVWRSHDRGGNPHWHVYDAQTNHTTNLSSEAEMRIWIEEHYDHRP